MDRTVEGRNVNHPGHLPYCIDHRHRITGQQRETETTVFARP